MGAHKLGREMAAGLQAEGIVTALIDSNWHNVSQARMAGLTAYYGNAYAEYTFDEIDFNGIGRFLALTGNAEANALASLHFADIFGRAEVYHLATPGDVGDNERKKTPLHLNGRVLFGSQLTYVYLTERIEAGDVLKATRLTDNFDFDDYQIVHPQAIPLFLLKNKKTLFVFTAEGVLTPLPGDLVFSFTPKTAPERIKQNKAADI
ncbi:MAG: NAD-binding protein [Chloroflexi bacterium]|nr:NAD-binding protein [Chloroflexota bacterium]